jgi:hypothetical protein
MPNLIYVHVGYIYSLLYAKLKHNFNISKEKKAYRTEPVNNIKYSPQQFIRILLQILLSFVHMF